VKKYIPHLFVFIVIVYLLFLIRPALLGQLGGTFKKHSVPNEYVQLEKFLGNQNNFSRTLWVPVVQRFGFYSYQHPAVSAEDFFHVASVSGVIDMLNKENAEKMLEDAGVKYVVVPYDSEGEIFLKDRKYSNALYEKTVQDTAKIPWLKKNITLGKIIVFSVPFPKDHFFLLGNGKVSYRFVNPTEYVVTVKDVREGEQLVFSETYDRFWQAKFSGKTFGSELYKGQFNSFVLPQNGSYTLTIFYQPQQWVIKGLYISGATLFVLGGYGLWLFLKSRAQKRKI
jgi:hypothetical protein